MATGVTREGARTPSPEGHATPPVPYTTWDDYMADVEQDARQAVAWRHDEEARQIGKAMRLAPNILVFRALLDGQDVPVDALDQQWRRRYGL